VIRVLAQTLWYALSVFSAKPLPVSQAARRLGTTRQAVQRSANELLTRGLAATETNPDHRASPFIVLTPKGRDTPAASSPTRHSRRRFCVPRLAERSSRLQELQRGDFTGAFAMPVPWTQPHFLDGSASRSSRQCRLG
jgi:DNA-binding MarR family transcriptional regulator